MRKYLEIVNHRTFILLALCVLSVYACLRLDYAYDVDWIFLSIAVLFPLVFSIREAFRRRQLAIRYLSTLKASISAFYFGLENNIKIPIEEKKQLHDRMRHLSGRFTESLKAPDDEGIEHLVREAVLLRLHHLRARGDHRRARRGGRRRQHRQGRHRGANRDHRAKDARRDSAHASRREIRGTSESFGGWLGRIFVE